MANDDSKQFQLPTPSRPRETADLPGGVPGWTSRPDEVRERVRQADEASRLALEQVRK